MSKTWQDDVTEFHRAFCPEQIAVTPTMIGMDVELLRLRLISEEVDELDEALDAEDLPDIADAIVDLLYVTIGTAVALGIELQPVWDAVHEANLRKIPTRRADGKILKNPDWVAPDIAAILAAQKPLAIEPPSK